VSAGSWCRHSPRQLALLVALLSRALLGWCVAYPLVALTSSLGAGALAGGDRALFQPSGLLLLELLRRGAEAWPAAAGSSLLLLGAALTLHTLPTALVFAVFTQHHRDVASALRRARARVGRFFWLGVLELTLTALVCVIVWWAWSALGPAEPRAWAALSAFALTLALLAGIGIGCDLARAASIGAQRTVASAFTSAAEVAARRGYELAAGYVLVSGTGALALALSARAVSSLSVEREGSLRVVAAFALHLCALAALSGLQALWVRRLGAYATPVSPRA
jgi:hypothetical protein